MVLSGKRSKSKNIKLFRSRDPIWGKGIVKQAGYLALDLNDGLYFWNFEIQDLLDQGGYGGYRIKVPFQIGALPVEERKLNKLSRVHLDIGFGDEIVEEPENLSFSRLIEGEPSLSWRIYPLESIIPNSPSSEAEAV